MWVTSYNTDGRHIYFFIFFLGGGGTLPRPVLPYNFLKSSTARDVRVAVINIILSNVCGAGLTKPIKYNV